jgi:hypothetical protein
MRTYDENKWLYLRGSLQQDGEVFIEQGLYPPYRCCSSIPQHS